MAADSKAKLLQDAEYYVLHGKLQQAIGEYLKIIQLDPRDVLTLNTIGDLYLRQNNSYEANRCFLQVADAYVQNNFFLKAIAVYKKILNADPNNLEINLTMASLFTKQGLGIEARNQYFQITALLEKDGKTRELLEVYEKIVELDPSNSALQRKLAEMHLAAGVAEKAHDHWAGAARAQVKAGDLAGAADSFRRAMQLAPIDVDSMKGYLECCLKMHDPESAIEQLKKSVETAPENLDLREMLGRAYLESGDAAAAAKAFQVVVSMDESRYENFFPVAQMLIDNGECDHALYSLDSIIPILITRRETGRAIELYQSILRRDPKHILAMTKLASIYSAIGDQTRNLAILDEIVEYYMGAKRPVEAIEYLEKIIQADPESDKHRKLHQQAFLEAYPDSPYVPPADPREFPDETAAKHIHRDSASAGEGEHSELVEVDLLLNYGLRDKALSLLQSLQDRDPCDKEVRIRLLSIYRAQKKFSDAAEQCLFLAALHRKAKNEESALGYLAEAKQLDPEMAEDEADLDAFARRNGILPEASGGVASAAGTLNPEEEVDLSGDLLDIFYAGDQGPITENDSEAEEIQEAIEEGYAQGIPAQAASKSLEEQLQEVDFYIRLGFDDEALSKLNEISRTHPNNSELALRYEKLGGTAETPKAEFSGNIQGTASGIRTPTPVDDSEDFQLTESDESPAVDEENQLEELNSGPKKVDSQDFVSAAGGSAEHAPERRRLQNVVPFEFGKSSIKVNEMFADLLEEVGASDQAVARTSFEEHFSLGTAYREMDLIEEAIKEFQIALRMIDLHKTDPKVVQCCGMLSTCFLKKNMPRSALRWCQAGLKIPDISSHEATALRYDMGVAHSMAGNSEKALECFDHIFCMDPSYRDVAQRIDELRGGCERHAPYP